MTVDLTARWMRDGSCVHRPDLPWTTDTDRLRVAQLRAMSRVCGGCLVRNHCAAYAVEASVTGGFCAGQDRDLLAPRRLDTTGTPFQPSLPGLAPSLPGLAPVVRGKGRAA